MSGCAIKYTKNLKIYIKYKLSEKLLNNLHIKDYNNRKELNVYI